jgi:hypothetical protein
VNDYQLEDMLDAQSRALLDSRSSGAVEDRPARPAISTGRPGHTGGAETQPAANPASLGEVALALTPLFLLAQEIAALLLPMAPRAEYRRALHRSLIKQARNQEAQRLLELADPSHTPFVPDDQPLPYRVAGWITQETATLDVDRRWVLGAAAVGSAVSLAGILAYVLSHRGRAVAEA